MRCAAVMSALAPAWRAREVESLLSRGLYRKLQRVAGEVWLEEGHQVLILAGRQVRRHLDVDLPKRDPTGRQAAVKHGHSLAGDSDDRVGGRSRERGEPGYSSIRGRG